MNSKHPRSLEPEKPRAFLMTAALTGARHGELLGLQLPDIDFDTGSLYISRSVTWAKGHDGEYAAKLKTVKTRAGRRALAIAPELGLALKEWKLACPKGGIGLVFPNENGLPQQRNLALRWIEAAATAAGVPVLNVKALRHTFASLALSALKKSPPEVAYLMGHSSPQVTMTVYAHWIREVKSTATAELATAILGGRS